MTPLFDTAILPSGSLAVLPTRPRLPVRLDAAGALRLALLGATACRLTSLARVLDTVNCFTGAAWNPPQEVVLAALQAETAAATILATESWVRSIPFFYTLTPAGAAAFKTLMRLPLPCPASPAAPSIAEVKFCLLDFVDSGDAMTAVADLSDFYLAYRDRVAMLRPDCPGDRPLLDRLHAERIALAEGRLVTLGEFAPTRNPAPH